MSVARAFLIAIGAGASASPAAALAFDLSDRDVGVSTTAILAAAWLAFAVWAIIRGARASAQARIAHAWGLRLRGLLSTTPWAYLVVGSDGAAFCSDVLRGWLDVDHKVTRFEDLAPSHDGGMMEEDFDALRTDISALAVSGTGFTRLMRANGSARVLIARGRPAPFEVAGDQGVVIWFSDATDTQAEVETLRRETQQLAAELAAMTALVEAAPYPIWRRSPDLRLRHVNAAYVEAVQAESADMAVSEGIELVNSALDPVARRARDSGEPQRREQPAIIAEARKMLHIVDVPLSDGGVGGYAIDISDLAASREERERLDRAQRQTFDRLSAGIVRFSADHSLTFHNKAFGDLFRIEHAWLEERPEFDRVLERMREARRLPEQRDFPSWRRARRAWFTDAVEPVEETWALPDSSVIRVIAQPHPDGGLLMVFEDRSEQLKLASSRDTLVRVQQATLDNLHEAVAVFGADGRLQLANKRFAELWSIDRALLVGKPHIDELQTATSHMVSDPARDAQVRDIIHLTTASDRREARSGRIDLRDGRILEFAAVPLPDGNVLFTYLDVSDSQRIETVLRDRNEALEAADRLKSAFVANISYELRTPLTAISGFGEMLAAGYAGELNPRQTEYVGSIVTSSDRLQLLIDDILDLAITEAGQLALDMGNVGVEGLAKSVAAMASDAAQTRGLALHVAVDETAGAVEGDERRLKQALYNLLANAIRFTPPGGHVELAATGNARGVTIRVIDNGVGIPPEEQELVFDRFWKGSNAGPQGVGLGLALVRQFVELHGGQVELESRVGGGTTMTVRLPRKQSVAHSAVVE
ncbi:ATP-binding protein [Sphingoaurantiacus capsulatus]|uniref:histidine kinase n=1 Tax=Sphingoaurantiacus capsulatus TaxID=1771310 RepID=A0ABV7X899_9SPHN